METKQKSARVAVSLLALAGLAVFSLFAVGGSLEPAAPPGPTMKTLDEVEPRTPISLVPYIILNSGSYYLSANAQTTSSFFSGITIWADNVTLDLKGFSLIGDGTAGLHGVVIEGDYKNITIRNGTITNWGGNGVEAATATKCRVEDLHVINNKGSGIHLPGAKQVVRNCVVSDNGASATSNVYGIYVLHGSTVTGNTVNNNGTSADDFVIGIYAFPGSTVTGNTVYNNGNSADGSVYGFHALNGCTVTGNTSHENGISAAGNVYGIITSSGCTVAGNTAHHNGNSATGTGKSIIGIKVGAGCTVTGNTAYSNGESTVGEAYGIYTMNGCTVTGNTTSGNTDYGIRTDNYCLVDQNTAYGNGTNMSTGAGCQVGLNVAP